MFDDTHSLHPRPKIADRETMRVLRDVAHQAQAETRRLLFAKFMFVFLSAIVGLILLVDYMAGWTMFDYLDPTLGGESLGPAFLALTIPIAVIAIHLILGDDKGQNLQYRLRRLAVIGVFVFLFGAASMIALVYLDAADGLGSSGNDTSFSSQIGNETLGSGSTVSSPLLAAFAAIMSNLSPIVFFAGMTLMFFVTVYVCHVLIGRIEQHFEFFFNASGRAIEVRCAFDEAQGLIGEIEELDAEWKFHYEQLPRDVDDQFARLTSHAILDRLHEMRKSLNGLGEPDVLLKGVFERKAHVPSHIETKAEGLKAIASIRHETAHYGILKQLGCVPPKKKET